MKTLTQITLLTGILAIVGSTSHAQPAPENREVAAENPRPRKIAVARDNQGPSPRNLAQNLPTMERVLTEDQRDSMRQTMEAQREKLRANAEKIRETRKAMMAAAFAADFNEDAVRAKALEVAKLEAELSVLRMKAIAEVQPALSKDQIEKLLNPPAGMIARNDDRNPNDQRPRSNNRRNRPEGQSRDSEAEPRPPRPDDQ